MNQTRSFLILGLLFVAYLLFNQWVGDYHKPVTIPATSGTVASAPASAATAGVPNGTASTSSNGSATATTTLAGTESSVRTGESHIITVTTDLLRLSIDTRGGTVVGAQLLQYPKSLGSQQDVQLLSSSPKRFYEAQSGLIGINGSVAPNHKNLFHATKSSYTLAPGQEKLEVRLTWNGPSGVTVTKVYTVWRDKYSIRLAQVITNHGNKSWSAQPYHQLERVTPPEPDYGNFLKKYSDISRYSFFGGAWYGPDEKFNKIKFDDFKDHPLAQGDQRGRTVTNGWFAMEQSYFVGAWLPSQKNETATFSTAVVDKAGQPHYLIRGIGSVINVAPGGSATSTAQLYLGPKIPSLLKQVSPTFDLALNYGMMTIVARPLHWVLAKLEALTGNWGWAIVLLVLLINAACYKLYAIQFRSAARMRGLKPRLDALKERYGSDRQKLQQATMELYKKEKVNPIGGCLPVLVTLPVFFGLYELLRESVELRQAPFIGWIHDLSAADPYFVLPILYAAVMLVQSITMPMTPGMDGMQQKMMKFMPVAMAVFFAFFPAGLALYYFVNGLCRLAVQWWVYRQVDREEARKKAAKA